MQFAAIQQFPLDLIPRIETDGRRQSQWKADIKSGLLALRADGLDF